MFKKELACAEIVETVDFEKLNDLVYLNDISQFNSDLLLFSPTQEDTLDVADPQKNNVFPVSPRGPPERLNFQGSLNFEVQIDSSDTHKRKYLYSHKLNRIYVDIKCNFLVHFKFDFPKWASAMYIRAMTVFSDEAQKEKRVERCLTHESTDSNIQEQNITKNVLHSAREYNSQGVYYCGDPNMADSWYSVIVEFPNSISEDAARSHAYQFVCKNSCNSGINRRSIDVIFTLEDAAGKVYGRQTVGVRVCACPKRDIKRDEKCENVARSDRKRRISPSSSEGKKLKVETLQHHAEPEEVLVTPSFCFAGTHETIRSGLNTLVRFMELEKQSKKKESELIQNCITPIKSYLEELEMKTRQNSTGYYSV